MSGIELKDWMDIFLKVWSATVATIALIVSIRKKKPPRKATHKVKPKRKR